MLYVPIFPYLKRRNFMESMFNVRVDSSEKKEILLELGWTVNKGWTNCPRYIYDELNEDSLDEYYSSLDD